MRRRGARADRPAVVGAVIDPGFCLDPSTQASRDVIKAAFDQLAAAAAKDGGQVPVNKGELRRERDCAVLNCLFATMPEPRFQTVRGLFTEGGPLFEGAGIQAKTHVQFAVRDLSCIRGVFRIRA